MAGRPKGSKNNKTILEKFLIGVFSEVDPAAFGRKLLRSKDERIQAQIYLRLLEYQYGRPAQQLEHTGKDGEQLAIMVRHIVGTQPSA